MNGAVAAGHPLTAEAGARILAEGGNAVDACIAAAFTSWVAESPLTGPGAGGFLLVHRARDRTTRVLDFYVAIPGLGLGRRHTAEMESVDVDLPPIWLAVPMLCMPLRILMAGRTLSLDELLGGVLALFLLMVSVLGGFGTITVAQTLVSSGDPRRLRNKD